LYPHLNNPFQTHLLNQAIAKDAEVKHLGQGISQVADDCEGVDVHSVDFGGLVCQQGQLDGRGQHVQQQGSSVSIANGSHQAAGKREKRGKGREQDIQVNILIRNSTHK